MSKTLYETLGVPPDADKPAIKRAYRKKAQKHHPDMKGGSKEAFLAVQKAYDILTDDERHQRYDKFDDTGEQKLETLAAKTLVGIMKNFVSTVKDVRREDIVRLSRGFINEQNRQGEIAVSRLRQQIPRWREAIKRTKCKTNDFVAAAFEREITGIEASIKNVKLDQELGRLMLTLLDDHTYTVDKVAEPSFKNNYGMTLSSLFLTHS